MKERQWIRAIVLLCVIFHERDWYKIAKGLTTKYSKAHLYRLRHEVRKMYGF